MIASALPSGGAKTKPGLQSCGIFYRDKSGPEGSSKGAKKSDRIQKRIDQSADLWTIDHMAQERIPRTFL